MRKDEEGRDHKPDHASVCRIAYDHFEKQGVLKAASVRLHSANTHLVPALPLIEGFGILADLHFGLVTLRSLEALL